MVFTRSARRVVNSQSGVSLDSTSSKPSLSCPTSSTHFRQCLVLKAVVLSLVALAAVSSLGMAWVGGVEGAQFQLERVRNILHRWKCPGGGYPAGSQKSKVLCLKCPTGHECRGGFNPPQKCAPGKYQHLEGQTFCYVCPQGYYNSLPARKGCRPASPGSFVGKTSQKKQTTCPKNTYQPKSAQKSCLPCPSGSASGPGATACSSGPEAICGNKCPKTKSPVCGSDGISYPNKCVLGCALQPARCQTKCPCASNPLPVMEGSKLASKRKCGCPKIYAPVCGMDSKTYANACLAHCREKIVACRGKCPCGFGGFPPIKGMTHRPTRRPTTRPVVGLVLGSQRVDAKNDQEKNVAWANKYFYVRQRLGWKHAQEYCVRKGSQLAVIHSMKEHRAVADACQDECWIGGDRGSTKDGFGWSDESRIDFENWSPHGAETGLCMQTNGAPHQKWVGADCERSLPFVCQNDYNFPIKLADESAMLENNFSGRNILIIWSTVVAVSLIGFAGVVVWHTYCTTRKETNDVIEEVEEPVSDRTPLLPKQTMQA